MVKAPYRRVEGSIALCTLLCSISTVLYAKSPVEIGKFLYEKNCVQCHGLSGAGDGYAAQFVNPKPRDFTKGKFKIRSTGSGELPTDKDLMRIIRKGMPYTSMPAWPEFNDDEVMSLVAYIKTFSADFANPEYNHPKEIEIPKRIKYSKESVKRGRQVFEANECIKCHGNQARGSGPSALTTKDDWGNHLRPADLTMKWTLRGGGTPEDIYRTISTGFNGTPMPAHAEVISAEDRWHLVNYLFSLSDKTEAPYTNVIAAKGIEIPIKLDEAESLFSDAPAALLPMVGQIIEPGREFAPPAKAIEVKAVYNDTEVAFMLRWHDMSSDLSGSNSPSIEVSEADVLAETAPATTGTNEEDLWGEEDSSASSSAPAPSPYSDAVAVQFPAKPIDGYVKPYFIWGDSKRAVNVWFSDLARSSAQAFNAKGSKRIKETDTKLESRSQFLDGEWTVVIKGPRESGKQLQFNESSFVPVAFSVWDGFSHERGNRRALTAWFDLYMSPMHTPSPFGPMFKYGFLMLLAELLLIYALRRSQGDDLIAKIMQRYWSYKQAKQEKELEPKIR